MKFDTLILPILLIALVTTLANANDPIQTMILKAGNTDNEVERISILKEIGSQNLDESLRNDLNKLIQQIERWNNSPRLEYFGPVVVKTGKWDFGIAPDSPLYPLTELYRARMLIWTTLEYGNIWSHPDRREEYYEKARNAFSNYNKHFPENRIARMYLGEPIYSEKDYPEPSNAPAWAAAQREGLERLADIIEWWIDHRLRENGEYGGGWGDDCEMWRNWVPCLIAFVDPKIDKAQAFFSNALLNLDYMRGGYTSHMTDVEHSAEDSSDAMTPMMHLDPDNPEWKSRALRLIELMETVWTGTNERGQLQFKSTYFNSEKADDNPQRACDSVYHPRAIQPALLYWQRTGDKRVGRIVTQWMDTWVDASMRSERGKPAGIVPSAIHWPDGTVGGAGEDWWNPENYGEATLYRWPSAMPMMLNTLLLTYQMTGDEKYMQPIRAMAKHRMEYLEHPTEGKPGSLTWCASQINLSGVLAKYRLLTGSDEFDTLLKKEKSPYSRFRMNGEREAMVSSLQQTAQALSVNVPGYTSEVRFTDRVVRFPALFHTGLAKPKEPVDSPSLNLLYATATGDPGDPLYFPINRVRWLTLPREIAALVTDSGKTHFEAELYHFGNTPREMGAELYLLEPGEYVWTLSPADDPQHSQFSHVIVDSQRTRIAFELPSRRLCRLTVHKAD